MRFAFEHAGLHRVQPAVMPRNVARAASWRRRASVSRAAGAICRSRRGRTTTSTRPGEEHPGTRYLTPWPFPDPLRRCARPRLRAIVRETQLDASHFVLPLFVEQAPTAAPHRGLPGIDRLSIAAAVEEAGEAAALGIPAVMLFGIPAPKDAEGSGAWDDEGVVQLATRAIKDAHPDLLVITDLCLCEYTSHGHCGVLATTAGSTTTPTLELLARTAVSQAAAGADASRPAT